MEPSFDVTAISLSLSLAPREVLSDPGGITHDPECPTQIFATMSLLDDLADAQPANDSYLGDQWGRYCDSGSHTVGGPSSKTASSST